MHQQQQQQRHVFCVTDQCFNPYSTDAALIDLNCRPPDDQQQQLFGQVDRRQDWRLDIPRSAESKNYDPSNERGNSWPLNSELTVPMAAPLLRNGHRQIPPNRSPPTFVSQYEDTHTWSPDTALNISNLLLGPANAVANLGSQGDNQSQGTLEPNYAAPRNDPISAHIINRPSAQHLISSYFTHFEYNIGFLDPALYTFDYIQRSSNFLFTTLLTISARVFRPDLYESLRAHAEILLGSVLLSCDTGIENVWAIICMFYWKEITDKRGYTMIGFAMRLAVSSGWNASKKQHQAQHCAFLTEQQFRKHRDRERIWLHLSSLDRT